MRIKFRSQTPPLCNSLNNQGQALVEFTLCFILLLVVAWIPADFGLAFYTGQLAQNASREGARIAAAEKNLATASCNMPPATTNPCSSVATGTPLRAAADRLSSALMPNANIVVELAGGTTCDRLVTVRVSGTYTFFFYRILRFLGASVPASTPINRVTRMRWEHQC